MRCLVLCVLALLLASHENASLAKEPAKCPAKASNGAIELQDGRVLLAASEHSCIYDPKRRSWSRPIPLQTLRLQGRMTRLPDGSVLLVGGHNHQSSILDYEGVAMSERFLPAQQTWVQSGSLARAQDFVDAPGVVTLRDGNAVAVSRETEFFSSALGVWLPASHLTPFIDYQAIVALPGQRIIAIGGMVVRHHGPDVVSYDGPSTTPSQKTWWIDCDSASGLSPDFGADIRSGPTQAGIAALLRAALLQTDSVPVRWQTGPRLHQQHAMAAAALLSDGSILIAGGIGGARDEDIVDHAADRHTETRMVMRSVERLYPDGGRVELVAPMQVGRFAHTLVTLPSGRVLALGGSHATMPYRIARTVEEYDPVRNRWRMLPALKQDHFRPSAIRLDDGSILVTSSITLPEIYRPPRNG